MQPIVRIPNFELKYFQVYVNGLWNRDLSECKVQANFQKLEWKFEKHTIPAPLSHVFPYPGQGTRGIVAVKLVLEVCPIFPCATNKDMFLGIVADEEVQALSIKSYPFYFDIDRLVYPCDEKKLLHKLKRLRAEPLLQPYHKQMV